MGVILDNYLYGKRPGDPGELKEIKVQVPLELFIKLHGLKLLNGRSIGDMVQDALDLYFHRITEEKQKRKLESEPNASSHNRNRAEKER